MNRNAKECFYTTFLQMISTTGVEKLSVKRICDNAGFPRETFYYHFQNLEDFLEKCTAHFFLGLLSFLSKALMSGDKWRRNMLFIAQKSSEIRPFFEQEPLIYLFEKQVESKFLKRIEDFEAKERTTILLDYFVLMGTVQFIARNPDKALDGRVLQSYLSRRSIKEFLALLAEILQEKKP